MRIIGDDYSARRRKKAQWTPEEDILLMKYIQKHGEGKWRTLPQKAGLQRCGKGCRLRWTNYLRPNVKRGNISLEEEDLIIRLHKLLGNRWSMIAGRVPGRTDNEIKNYWNSHLSKKLRCNVTIEAIPRLNKSSSSLSDPLHLHSYAEKLIDGEILYGYNCSSLPDCQPQEDHLKSSHFDWLGHMACAFQPHTPIEDSSTRFCHCQYAECNGKNYSSEDDVGFSIEDCLRQPLPPQDNFSEINGLEIHSVVAMQQNYCSSPSLCINGCYGEIWGQNNLGSDYRHHYDEKWEHSDLGCRGMRDSIITDFGEFGGDAPSINFLLGNVDNVHDNMNSVEQKPCHDLHTLQAVNPIISFREHCTNAFYTEDKADAFAQVSEMNTTMVPPIE